MQEIQLEPLSRQIGTNLFFDADLSVVICKLSFYDNKNLVEFKSDISTISAAQDMFSFCSNLESFEADTTALINGYRMFLCLWKIKEHSS